MAVGVRVCVCVLCCFCFFCWKKMASTFSFL